MKTLKDLEEMKITKCLPFESEYDALLMTLEDYYIAKLNGVSRIKCELKEWDNEAQKVIKMELTKMIIDDGIIDFDPSELD